MAQLAVSLHCTVILGVVLLFFIMLKLTTGDDDYLKQRSVLLVKEKQLFTGGETHLTSKENAVNELILSKKRAELLQPSFLASKHFFQSKPEIDKSEIFSIIRKLPKGASLHTHLTAGVSADFIINNITYRDNVYGCFLNGTFKLKFFQSADAGNNWKALSEYRKADPNFDVWLKTQLSLVVDEPSAVYPSPDIIWTRFKKIFTTVYDMVSYKPVFKDYILQLLTELYDDNVLYTELRGTFMPLYELDGTVYDTKDFFRVFIQVVEEFKRDHPKFLGVRYIHSIYRGVAPEVLKAGLDELIQLQKLFPRFIAGFDFVGYEEEGRRMVDFHDVLLQAGRSLKFFFHAGETNWYGSTDLNLVDAVLLNSSRIGHGFALPKHTLLMDIVKSKGIAVELCPISNQVLMLERDPRNHPVVSLLAKAFPVVVCNDDPSAWGATGLSYDWYVAFMAMTPEDAGVEVLKSFAVDSIKYSAMEEEEKDKALQAFEAQWQAFLDEMLK